MWVYAVEEHALQGMIEHFDVGKICYSCFAGPA